MRERPAWIDPAKQAAGGPKTEFIDAAAMREMIQVDEQQAVGEAADVVEAPMLLITSGGRNGQTVNLRTAGDRGEWTIGCDDDRDIVLADQGVSGIHAKLAQDPSRMPAVEATPCCRDRTAAWSAVYHRPRLVSGHRFAV